MNTKEFLAVACLTSLMVGCVSYNGAVFPGDDLVDEGNRPFAEKAAKDYAARQKFQRPVVIREAEGVSLFLSPNYVPRSNNGRANELCRNIETRRALLQSAKAKLREVVMGLKKVKPLTGVVTSLPWSVTENFLNLMPTSLLSTTVQQEQDKMMAMPRPMPTLRRIDAVFVIVT